MQQFLLFADVTADYILDIFTQTPTITVVDSISVK